MIPVTVIGGYLGAGKTTLINGLLAGDHGRRLAVLVNDFGAINIDAKLIAGHDGDTIALSNGCVCCTIADALGAALDKVLAMAVPPDHIVIEASGIANPAKIAMYGQGWPGLCLDGVVVLVDGETIQARAADKFVGATIHQQLTAADILVITKTDLLSGGQRQGAIDWLTRQKPQGRVILASHGDIPASVLLGHNATGAYQTMAAQGHGDYRSLPFQTTRPMDRSRLKAQMMAWPKGLLRAKGLVHLRDDPSHAYILQLVGRRHSLEKGPAWPEEKRETQLVLIGVAADIDPSSLQASLLSACV